MAPIKLTKGTAVCFCSDYSCYWHRHKAWFSSPPLVSLAVLFSEDRWNNKPQLSPFLWWQYFPEEERLLYILCLNIFVQ